MAVDANSLVTLVSLKAYLGVTSTTDDAILEQFIDRASSVVQSFCFRKFVAQRYYETYATTGQRRIGLRQRPITHIHMVATKWDNAIAVNSTDGTDAAVSVFVDEDHVHAFRVDSSGTEHTTNISFGSNDTTVEVAAAINAVTGFSATATLNFPARYLKKAAGRDLKNRTIHLEAWSGSPYDYQIDHQAGILYGPQVTSNRGLFIDYEAGYDTIPYDIQQATMQIASRMYHGRKRDPSMASESLGGYSYSTRGTAEVDAEAKEMLAPYRRYL